MKMMNPNAAKRKTASLSNLRIRMHPMSQKKSWKSSMILWIVGLKLGLILWISMNCLLIGTSATGCTTASNFCLIMFVLLIV